MVVQCSRSAVRQRTFSSSSPMNIKRVRYRAPAIQSSERHISTGWRSAASGSMQLTHRVQSVFQRARASRLAATFMKRAIGTTQRLMTAAYRAGALDCKKRTCAWRPSANFIIARAKTRPVSMPNTNRCTSGRALDRCGGRCAIQSRHPGTI